MTIESRDKPFRILVCEQKQSGQSKIQGIEEVGQGLFSITRHEIGDSLTLVVDDTSPYLPDSIEADLVLDYLKHPDLSLDLAVACSKLGVPVVASGRKILNRWALTTPLC